MYLIAENAAVKNLDFGARLDRNLRIAVLTTDVSLAVCGENVERNALSSLEGTAVDTVSVHFAYEMMLVTLFPGL